MIAGWTWQSQNLLKNFLFHKAGNRLAEAQDHWTTMTGVLEATSEDEVLVTYLRHYWSSVQGLTRERDLYKRVKRGVTTISGAVDLTRDLKSKCNPIRCDIQHQPRVLASIWSDHPRSYCDLEPIAHGSDASASFGNLGCI